MLHSFKFLLKILRKHPLRSVLMLLQIAIGIASITFVLSFTFSTLLDLQQVDDEKIIQARYDIKPPEDIYIKVTNLKTPVLFTNEMIDYLEQEKSFIDKLTIIERPRDGMLEYDGIRYQYRNNFYGVGANFANISNMEILEGNFFTNQDLKSQNPVILISSKVNQQLFGEKSGLGRVMQLATKDDEYRQFKIIGIFSMNEQLFSEDIHFVVPYSVVNSSNCEEKGYSELWFTCQSDQLARAKDEFSTIFYQEVGRAGIFLEEDMELIFTESDEQIRMYKQEALKTYGLFLSSFAFIALVITAVSILSMMIVSIVERTREIGLRRALGASKRNIITQILSESIFISLLGGICGIFLAIIVFKPVAGGLWARFWEGFVGQVLPLETNVFLLASLAALGIAVLIGLITGFYPGLCASRLIPVEAIKER